MKATIPLLFFALHLPSVSSFLENPTTTTHASTPYPASLLPAFALPTTLSITYCDGCAWLPRSQWYTTELLSTFYTRRVQSGLPPLIDSALLSISREPGDFTVSIGDDVVWDRRADGGFPDLKVLKDRVRGKLDPGSDLGHTDRALESSGGEGEDVRTVGQGEESEFSTHLFAGEEALDDDELLQMRRMWGVM